MLHIELPTAIEKALREQAAAEGKDISTLITEVITERLAVPESRVRPSVRAAHGFAERLNAWIELHPRADRTVGDGRDSIYAGRGE